MDRDTTARLATMVLGVFLACPVAAEAKEAAVTHSRKESPPAAAQCFPSISVDALSKYLTERIRVLNAQIERLFELQNDPDADIDALMIELQVRMSELETSMQMRENLERLVADPPPDVPDADGRTCTPPRRNVPEADDPFMVPGT